MTGGFVATRCRVKGASEETSPERPVLSVTQVYTLADVIDPRYRALVLLAAFAVSIGSSPKSQAGA